MVRVSDVSGLGVEVKEEEFDEAFDSFEGCSTGPAMQAYLAGRAGSSAFPSYRSLVPGVESLPHGRIPELLGFSELEIQNLLPERALGAVVPYLGEASSSRRRVDRPELTGAVASTSGRGSLASSFERLSRGSGGRDANDPSHRRRSRSQRGGGRRGPYRHASRRSQLSVGRLIRPLSSVNRLPQNHPIEYYYKPSGSSPGSTFALRTSVGHIPQVPESFHRRKYDESTENRLGRFHPEDGRLVKYGVWDAIYEDLELYKIPPAWWPSSLSYSDYYSSSSSDTSGSDGKSFFLELFFVDVWRGELAIGRVKGRGEEN